MPVMQMDDKKSEIEFHNCIEYLNDIIKFEKSTSDALFKFIIFNFPLAK